MGGAQAAGVLSQITRDAKERKGEKVLWPLIEVNSGLLKKKMHLKDLLKHSTRKKGIHILLVLGSGMMV